MQEESGEGDWDWGAIQGQEGRDRELQGNMESIGKDGMEYSRQPRMSADTDTKR